MAICWAVEAKSSSQSRSETDAFWRWLLWASRMACTQVEEAVSVDDAADGARAAVDVDKPTLALTWLVTRTTAVAGGNDATSLVVEFAWLMFWCQWSWKAAESPTGTSQSHHIVPGCRLLFDQSSSSVRNEVLLDGIDLYTGTDSSLFHS